MKKDIHPKYKKTKIVCACGNEFETRSTVFPEIKVELCSLCHPFYTGKQKFVDTAGRVDKFQARMEAAKAKKAEKDKNKGKSLEEKQVKDNKEVLKNIKRDITEKPEIVTQKMSSDEELAAASELREQKDDK